MANLKLIGIGGLILLIVVTLAVLIEQLTNKSNVSVGNLDRNDPTVDIDERIFDETFSKCLTEHSKSPYYLLDKRATPCIPYKKCMQSFLAELNQLMTTLSIHLKLMEPDLLFCLLPSSKKFNLVTRGFSKNRVLGSNNVITFGIIDSEVKILEQINSSLKIGFSGFGMWKYSRFLQIDQYTGDKVDKFHEFSHYFFMRNDMIAHLIVLYSRQTYLWSPGFITSEISLKGLQYVNDRVFENFNVSSIHLDTQAKTFLPSDTRCFLLDMMTSNFLECKAVSLKKKTEVNADVLEALKELKIKLASQMVSFCLWSRSLQGWLENCDILHYTGELKFAVAAKSVERFNFTGLFDDSECEHVETQFNLNFSVKSVKIKCYEISIDLIFMYEENVNFWYEYVDEYNMRYKIKLPKFTLCSTDIFGQKIALPCETSEILEGEYGEFLKNTTLTLNQENMKNVQLLDTN